MVGVVTLTGAVADSAPLPPAVLMGRGVEDVRGQDCRLTETDGATGAGDRAVPSGADPD